MKSRPSLISVIIVSKNDRVDIPLEHLQKQTLQIPCEVIVVDASKPASMAHIRAANPWVIWDQYPPSKQRTTPHQRNRGISLAKGEIIAFLDANCVPSATWLTAIRDKIEQGEHIVCGPVRHSSVSNLVHYAPELEQPRYVDVCTTISVGLDRKVIDAVGGFDENFLFGQDVDFFWRATDAGLKIFYDPKVAISHDWGDKREQLHRAFDYGKARAHLFKKHWRTRKTELLHESHVWVYPLFMVGLPVTFIFPFYPLLILVPVLKNRTSNPLGLILHHLTYGLGVIAGTLKRWPQNATTPLAQNQVKA